MNEMIGKGRASSKGAILAATRKLMVEEGYAAVSTRRVAKEVGVTSALVHYHFPTTDDLFLAVFCEQIEAFKEELARTLALPDPLRALWTLNSDATSTAIVIEFMALSNHRKAIRQEIVRHVEEMRVLQTAAVARALPDAAARNVSPLGLTVLVAGLARALVMEADMGATMGHEEAHGMVDAIMRFISGDSAKPG